MVGEGIDMGERERSGKALLPPKLAAASAARVEALQFF